MAIIVAILLGTLLFQHLTTAERTVEVQIVNFANKYNATTRLSDSGTLYCCCDSQISSCEWTLGKLKPKCRESRCETQFVVSLSPCIDPACCILYSEKTYLNAESESGPFRFLVSEETLLMLTIVARSFLDGHYYHIDEVAYELMVLKTELSEPVSITLVGRYGIARMIFTYRTFQTNSSSNTFTDRAFPSNSRSTTFRDQTLQADSTSAAITDQTFSANPTTNTFTDRTPQARPNSPVAVGNMIATSPAGSEKCSSSGTWAVAGIFITLTVIFATASAVLTCILCRGKQQAKKSTTPGRMTTNADQGHQLQESLHSACSREFQRHLDNVLQQRSNALATRYVESGPTETKERYYDEIVTPKWEDMARPYETPVPITPKRK